MLQGDSLRPAYLPYFFLCPFNASSSRNVVSPVEIFSLTIERMFYYSIAKDRDIVK